MQFLVICNVQWLGISVQLGSEQVCVALYKGTWTLSVIRVGQYWESVKGLKMSTATYRKIGKS
jgi:hypothetical protein